MAPSVLSRPLLTVHEVADHLGVSVRTVRPGSVGRASGRAPRRRAAGSRPDGRTSSRPGSIEARRTDCLVNQPYTLPPDVQRLIDEPLSEPPARARQLWKPLDKAIGRLDNLNAQQARYNTEVAHLREELESPSAATSRLSVRLSPTARTSPSRKRPRLTSDSTSWGSLVRAQYRPPRKPPHRRGFRFLGRQRLRGRARKMLAPEPGWDMWMRPAAPHHRTYGPRGCKSVEDLVVLEQARVPRGLTMPLLRTLWRSSGLPFSDENTKCCAVLDSSRDRLYGRRAVEQSVAPTEGRTHRSTTRTQAQRT